MRKRVPQTISWRTQADKDSAMLKCSNHGIKISQEIQRHFKEMPLYPDEKEKE